ncbi:MAG: hypothetical protein QOH12_907 [Solirubrobacteraceae bacterium]|jgi:hypothetical protein|nr:hypothetical protein [Solirubrobacteraceae bacterium]
MSAVLGSIVLVWTTLAPVGAAARSSAAAIAVALPTGATVGRALRLDGRVDRGVAGATAELERSAGAGRWTVLAKGRVRGGRFALRWTPRSPGLLAIRVVAVEHGRTIASTRAGTIAIGAAPIYCAAPDPPGRLPRGYGYIVGGVYNVGGPAPGITVCRGQDGTVTVTDAAGRTVASRTVAGGQSYTFVLPAGTYTLEADFCRGEASVRAGAGTHADTVCPVP